MKSCPQKTQICGPLLAMKMQVNVDIEHVGALFSWERPFAPCLVDDACSLSTLLERRMLQEKQLFCYIKALSPEDQATLKLAVITYLTERCPEESLRRRLLSSGRIQVRVWLSILNEMDRVFSYRIWFQDPDMFASHTLVMVLPATVSGGSTSSPINLVIDRGHVRVVSAWFIFPADSTPTPSRLSEEIGDSRQVCSLSKKDRKLD